MSSKQSFNISLVESKISTSLTGSKISTSINIASCVYNSGSLTCDKSIDDVKKNIYKYAASCTINKNCKTDIKTTFNTISDVLFHDCGKKGEDLYKNCIISLSKSENSDLLGQYQSQYEDIYTYAECVIKSYSEIIRICEEDAQNFVSKNDISNYLCLYYDPDSPDRNLSLVPGPNATTFTFINKGTNVTSYGKSSYTFTKYLVSLATNTSYVLGVSCPDVVNENNYTVIGAPCIAEQDSVNLNYSTATQLIQIEYNKNPWTLGGQTESGDVFLTILETDDNYSWEILENDTKLCTQYISSTNSSKNKVSASSISSITSKIDNAESILEKVPKFQTITTPSKKKANYTSDGVVLCVDNTNSCIQYSDNKLSLGSYETALPFYTYFTDSNKKVELLDGFNTNIGLAVEACTGSPPSPCLSSEIQSFIYEDGVLSLGEILFLNGNTKSGELLISPLPQKWNFEPIPQSLCEDFEFVSSQLNTCIQDFFRSSSNTPIGPVSLTNCAVGGVTKTLSISTPTEYSYSYPALGITNITGYSTNCTTIPCTYTPTMTTDSLTVCSANDSCTTYTGTFDYCSITTYNGSEALNGVVNSCSVSLISTNSTWSDTKLLIAPDSDIPLSIVYQDTAIKVAVSSSNTACEYKSSKSSSTCCGFDQITYCGQKDGREVSYKSKDLTFTNASVTGLDNASVSYASPLCSFSVTNVSPCSNSTTCVLSTTSTSGIVSYVTITGVGTVTSVDSTLTISIPNVTLNFDFFQTLEVYTCYVTPIYHYCNFLGFCDCCPSSCNGNTDLYTSTGLYGSGTSVFDLVFEVPVTLLVTPSTFITNIGGIGVPEICLNFSSISATTFTYRTSITSGTITIPQLGNVNSSTSIEFKGDTLITAADAESKIKADVQVFANDIVQNVLPPLIYTKIDKLGKLAEGFDVCKGLV